MKIAFLHYHLKTGGVTTVLKRQVSALQGRCEVLVLTANDLVACLELVVLALGHAARPACEEQRRRRHDPRS